MAGTAGKEQNGDGKTCAITKNVCAWGGFLTHLILVPPWVASALVNPIVVAACGWAHGPLGTAACLGVMVGVYLGPDSDIVRGALLSICWALAVTRPSVVSLAAAAYSSVMCWMVSGGPFAPKESFFQFMTRRFPLQSYYTTCELRGALDEIQVGKNCIAAYPHGCLSVGMGMNLIWNGELHRRTGRTHFLIDYGLRHRNPQFRLLADSYEGELRAMASADAATIQQIMQKGESWCFLPGGFTDATIMQYGKERIALHGKKGWVKHCLRGGYRIIPAYSFGESSTFFTFQPLLRFRLWLNKYNVPGVAFFGNPFAPFLPRRQSRVLTYLGPALHLPQIDCPSANDVEEWHGKYVTALKNLFDKFKGEAGQPDAVLEFMNQDGLFEPV